MKDIHELYTQFKEEFPEINSRYEAMGRIIHEEGGPLDERNRWLVKIGISGGSGHLRALETHMMKGIEAGVTREEIRQVLLLLISTVGFPAFMESYTVYKRVFPD